MPAYLIATPRCIFIRIPKTGSTSIIRGPFSNIRNGPVFGEIPTDWQSETAFAFVRNPFDRLISVWLMFRDYPAKLNQDRALRDNLSITDVINISQDQSIDLIGNGYLSKLRRHALPLCHPFNCLNYSGLIGRFEDFESELRRIGDHLGASITEIPHHRRTSREHYSTYYNARERSLASAAYAEDLKTHDYAFDS